MMDAKPFHPPVTVRSRNAEVAVCTVAEALDLLISPDWPLRGPRHRDATDTCLKVLEGYRSTEDARVAFAAAAAEASLLA
jgi:hypothetical protein